MRKIWLLLLLLVGALVACNLPGTAATSVSPNAVQTAAAMTVAAAMHTASVTAAPTHAPPQPTAPPTNTAPPTAPLAPSATPAPSPSPTPQPCNLAHFVTDVTVPDGTVFAPAATFTKTWRLQNVGTCTWENYSLVFDHGDAMGAPSVVPIAGVVAPGQEVDVSVNLTAPAAPGEYKGFWRLRDNKGVVFGLTTGNPFWVDIKVVAPTATPTVTPSPTPALPPPAMMVLDLYAQAPAASWQNGSGDHLPFPGPGNDSRGFVRYADTYTLEDGTTHAHVLETHPQWIPNGIIFGNYPSVTLPPNAHFRAKIGFIRPSGGCGSGSVDFVLSARFNGSLIGLVLQTWHKTCDGSLRSVDVDLSSYAGQHAAFSLEVKAGPSSAQDWAVWVSPIVSTP